MQRLAELFNVNHFIVSQVNPHARVLGQTHGWNSVSMAVKGKFQVAQYQLAKLVDFFKAQAKAYVGNLLKLVTATPLKVRVRRQCTQRIVYHVSCTMSRVLHAHPHPR
jgi:hypothetical protein